MSVALLPSFSAWWSLSATATFAIQMASTHRRSSLSTTNSTFRSNARLSCRSSRGLSEIHCSSINCGHRRSREHPAISSSDSTTCGALAFTAPSSATPRARIHPCAPAARGRSLWPAQLHFVPAYIRVRLWRASVHCGQFSYTSCPHTFVCACGARAFAVASSAAPRARIHSCAPAA